MKHLNLALLLFLIIGCSPTNQNEFGPTIITGKVINFSDSSSTVLSVFSYDFISSDSRFAIDITKSGYKFNQSFQMSHKHDVAINYNGEYYIFMAEPNDSIHVTIDAKTKEIKFSGDKSDFNNQVIKARAATIEKFNQIYEFNLDTSLNDVISQLEDKMQIIKDTLNIYCKNNNIQEDVKEYLLYDNLYGFANYVLRFDRGSEYSPKRNELFTHDIFQLQNSENAHSYMFSIHISNMLTDFLHSDPELKSEIFKDESDPIKISTLALDYILKLPKSAMRDILICRMFATLVNFVENPADIYDKRYMDSNNYYYPSFMDLYIKPTFNLSSQSSTEKIKTDLEIKSKLNYINASKGEVENIEEQDIMSYITKKYKGKVIYIDVWAVWCGPCLIEMNYAKDLHKIYHDMDIVFVNLALSSDFQKWTDMVAEKEISGENYFAEGDDISKLILSKYNLPGYPSYILIDKSGEIVTTSAFRPSQIDKLSVQLNELF